MDEQLKSRFEHVLQQYAEVIKERDAAVLRDKTAREQFEASFRAAVDNVIVPASAQVKELVARTHWVCLATKSDNGLSAKVEIYQGNMKAKQPYAIAMKDGRPFGLGGLWENWKEPTSGERIRTFTIITTDANEMVAEIHDRMPLIIAPGDYVRWLSDEPDPHDLLRPYPAELMRMWPISTRVNKPENDDPSIVDPVEVAA